MKAYTKFVNQVFTCISDLFPNRAKELDLFAEGSEQVYSSMLF